MSDKRNGQSRLQAIEKGRAAQSGVVLMKTINLVVSVMRTFGEQVESSYRSIEPPLIEQMHSQLRSQLAIEPEQFGEHTIATATSHT